RTHPCSPPAPNPAGPRGPANFPRVRMIVTAAATRPQPDSPSRASLRRARGVSSSGRPGAGPGRARRPEAHMKIDELLAQNRTWAAERVADDPDFFTRHLGGQEPHTLWIGCSDSRVPAEQLLGCGPGELFLHRNVANVVAYNDINVAAVIEYATGP